jgi:hypothetical protein
VQLNVEPHIITIGSVVGNYAQHLPTNELSQIPFADTANDDDDSRIFEECAESISAEDLIKPK